MGLLTLSDMYQLSALKSECEEHRTARLLTGSNVLPIFAAADRTSASALRKRALAYIVKNHVEVREQEKQLKELSSHQLSAVFRAFSSDVSTRYMKG